MSYTPAIVNVIHNQDTLSSTWTIVHNIGTMAPIIDVFVNYDGHLQKIIPREIVVIDNKTVQIQFSHPVTGKAQVA